MIGKDHRERLKKILYANTERGDKIPVRIEPLEKLKIIGKWESRVIGLNGSVNGT